MLSLGDDLAEKRAEERPTTFAFNDSKAARLTFPEAGISVNRASKMKNFATWRFLDGNERMCKCQRDEF